MIQRGKSIYENYMLNKELLSSVKSSRIDYVIIGHCHCDHIGLIPALYQKNCEASIIAPKGSTAILKEMWLDSAYINGRDADILTVQREHTYLPLFTEDDVYTALSHVQEIDFHEIVPLDEEVSLTNFLRRTYSVIGADRVVHHSEKSYQRILFTSDLEM